MKVDVLIQTYGKNWQLMCTLESLLTHSGEHIDKIYIMEEAQHPYGDNIKTFLEYYSDEIVHYKAKKWVNIYGMHRDNVGKENTRHQWGIEKSNKKYLFIAHNDVLFTGDVIGGMLKEIGDCVAIGQIGQCHNCPAKAYGLCSGETWNDWNPTYEEIMKLPMPHIRTRAADIDKENPKLMPECRVNEWAILINREICIKEGRPYFGEFNHDSGTEWFKSMYRKGYKFKNYNKDFQHCYWAGTGGYNIQQNEKLYWEVEEKAKKYFEEHYAQNFE